MNKEKAFKVFSCTPFQSFDCLKNNRFVFDINVPHQPTPEELAAKQSLPPKPDDLQSSPENQAKKAKEEGDTKCGAAARGLNNMQNGLNRNHEEKVREMSTTLMEAKYNEVKRKNDEWRRSEGKRRVEMNLTYTSVRDQFHNGDPDTGIGMEIKKLEEYAAKRINDTNAQELVKIKIKHQKDRLATYHAYIKEMQDDRYGRGPHNEKLAQLMKEEKNIQDGKFTYENGETFATRAERMVRDMERHGTG